MYPIHVVGAFSTILIGALYIYLVRKRVSAGERTALLGLALLTFFMPGLAYYAVRLPLDAWVRTFVEPTATTYVWIRLLYAPVTEELAKIWPLLVPAVARWITAGRTPRAAYALGLGFGVGEVAFLAVVLGMTPEAAQQRWYYYTGFVTERILVAPCHALFVFVTLAAWRRWRWPGGLVSGFCGAAALHFCLNVPIYFKAKGWLGSEAVAGQILMAWILVYFVSTLAVFARSIGGKGTTAGGFLFGETICKLCGASYQRPFWAMNLGTRRFERCPSCRKWHMQ